MVKDLADSRSNSLATNHHLKNSLQCLNIVCCSKMLEYISGLAHVHDHFHLDVLEAVFLKVHSSVLCQQKEFVKGRYSVKGPGNAGSLVFTFVMSARCWFG